ncbi:MAG TPA: BrnT family toxin [Pyrinomonadaceae bacterium]|nr:BrnT family toxin [Pyrinomonadaceae bacterium]
MTTEFEWDPKKAEANVAKHEVSFAEAATVFFDPLSLTVLDPLHSGDENRFVITGVSNHNRHLVVVHSDRGDKIRIISARLATSGERKKYESTKG